VGNILGLGGACPAGTAVHAAGFDLGSASGQAFVSTYILDTHLNSNPNIQGAEITAREDATGYSGTRRAPAGVAASPRAGVWRRTRR
jgi:hypothetical protein